MWWQTYWLCRYVLLTVMTVKWIFRQVIHTLFSLRRGITLAFDLWREWLDNDVSLKHNISGVNKGKNNQLRSDIIDEASAADL